MENRIYSDEVYIAANQNIKEKDYWLNQLSGDFVKSNFPFDLRRDTRDKPEIETVKSEWSGELFAGLMKLSSGMDIKLHIILVAGLKALLYKYTNNKDISIGSPVLKQDTQDQLINTILVYRTQLQNAVNFKELLLQVKETIIQAAENQNFPMEVLPEFLNLPVLTNEFPLFDIVLLLENIHDKAYLRGIDYHLLFSFFRAPDAVEVTIEYQPRLYEKRTIEPILNHFKYLLTQVLADVNMPLSALDLLSEDEKHRLLVDLNCTRMEYPKQVIISELFEKQAAETPDRTAVVVEDPETRTSQHLKYKELNERANQWARVLREKGVKAETVIAIMVERSLEMIISVIAVLKAGGAYLPVDPTYPAERIAFMLADSATKVLVTTRPLAKQGEKVRGLEGEKIFIEDLSVTPTAKKIPAACNLQPVTGPTNLAYVIYTSGSTGKPKGVLVQHNHFVNASFGWRKEYNLETMPVNLLQMASFSFDVFCGDLARTLLNGGKMVITPEFGVEPEFLFQLITRYEITLFESTPSYIVPFMQYVYDNHFEIHCLKLLIVGSDSCRVEDFKRLLANYGKKMRIINSYGVTEAAIDSSYYEGQPEDDTLTGMVPIGKPLPNVKFYIVDIDQHLLPVGVPGELYIGGDGIARGYLNRPELTAKKFNHDFWDYRDYQDEGQKSTSQRIHTSYRSHTSYIYKTGDYARWLKDGNVEFLGRMDHQVKIRGFRIELGEIESQLLSHEAVEETVVVERKDGTGEKYLCAYVVAGPVGMPDINELREYLSKTLPDYMIPSYFVQMEKMPITKNGKLDRKALPGPELGGGKKYVPPRDSVEEKMVELWAKVLFGEDAPHSPIGIDDNFFELGGQSLKATVLVYHSHKVFDVKLSLVQIFKTPTIRGLAEHIKGLTKDKYIMIQPVEKKEYYPLSSAQKRLYILQQSQPDNVFYNMPLVVRLEQGVDTGQVKEAFEKLIKRHESLRTSFMLIGNEPVQCIHDHVEFEIEYFLATEVTENTEGNFIRPFELSRAPLLRAGLIKLPGDGVTPYILMVDNHHIVSDGVSNDILIREFNALYGGESLPCLRLQYKDVAQWQNRQLRSGEVEKQEAYWLKEFKPPIPVLNLPLDFPRPRVQHFKGDMVEFKLSADQSDQLRALAKAGQVTMFTLLFTLYNVFLFKLSGQEDIIVGTVVAGRRHADLESVIGMFVNTLALRNYPSERMTFGNFLQTLNQRTVEALENQDYQFEDLVEKVLPNRDTSRNPLFDVLFTYSAMEPMPLSAPQPGKRELKTSPYDLEVSEGRSKFDMVLEAVDGEGPIHFTIGYCVELFKKETLERFTNYFKEVVSAVLQNKEIELKDIKISHALELTDSRVYENIEEHLEF
ncbi:MAG: amino acid adenylation domain-containing protein [Candidatus Aminicenantes bacterium]|nr:MAG: amino acid adenylation domain-containing protein [Candidatus Aminicenantes bacterium]